MSQVYRKIVEIIRVWNPLELENVTDYDYVNISRIIADRLVNSESLNNITVNTILQDTIDKMFGEDVSKTSFVCAGKIVLALCNINNNEEE
ncbi:hypothetical protein RJG79_08340 [Mycoplasmatota bacterium WC44]